MIETIPAPAHVAAFRCSGTLTGEDYDRCIADIETRLAAHRRIGLFCDMTGFTGLTPEALGKDLRYSLGKFGQFDRFAHVALITDRHWLGKASELAGRLFPGTLVRAFEPGEQPAAIAWAADVTQPED